MSEARGRFQIAVLNDVVYAVGGSNGKLYTFNVLRSVTHTHISSSTLLHTHKHTHARAHVSFQIDAIDTTCIQKK